MKISVEEVSRLLAFAPTERSGNRPTSNASSPSSDAGLQERGAAAIEFSPAAQEVQRVKRLVNDLPDVREDRVQALKAQIENGTYNVSGEDIADLMMRRMLADNATL